MPTVRMLRALFVVTFMASAGAASPTAALQQATRCTVEVNIVASPGLSDQPSSGAFHSNGETGTIKCADGRTGTFGTDGRYGTKNPSTCTSGGEGWGVQTFTIKGVTVRDTFTFTNAAVSQGTISGKSEGERLSGSFTVTPTDGDCFTKPMTKGTIKEDAVLQG